MQHGQGSTGEAGPYSLQARVGTGTEVGVPDSHEDEMRSYIRQSFIKSEALCMLLIYIICSW